VIGGAHLTKPVGENKKSSERLDPYVKVEVMGVESDCYEFKTATISNNGEWLVIQYLM